jgi:hypothetical protein
MNMASAPSSFYVNRDNYLAALDASRRAGGQFSPPSGGGENVLFVTLTPGWFCIILFLLVWLGAGCPAVPSGAAGVF